MLVHGAALDSHVGHSAATAFSRPGAPSMTTSSGVRNPRRTRSSSSARQAASPSPPMLLIASSIFWPSARTPSATSNEIEVALLSSRDTRDCAVEDQPHDRFRRANAHSRRPSRPSSCADAADHVLADRFGKHRVQRASHAAGVGPCEISPGDQGVGGPGAALVGAANRSAIRAPCRPRRSTERAVRRSASRQRARQRPLAMPVAHAGQPTVPPRPHSACADHSADATTPRKVPPPASSR